MIQSLFITDQNGSLLFSRHFSQRHSSISEQVLEGLLSSASVQHTKPHELSHAPIQLEQASELLAIKLKSGTNLVALSNLTSESKREEYYDFFLLVESQLTRINLNEEPNLINFSKWLDNEVTSFRAAEIMADIEKKEEISSSLLSKLKMKDLIKGKNDNQDLILPIYLQDDFENNEVEIDWDKNNKRSTKSIVKWKMAIYLLGICILMGACVTLFLINFVF